MLKPYLLNLKLKAGLLLLIKKSYFKWNINIRNNNLKKSIKNSEIVLEKKT